MKKETNKFTFVMVGAVGVLIILVGIMIVGSYLWESLTHMM